MNCCYDCPSINYPYLESPEQIDRFFPDSLNKIKFHTFKSISKCLIHGLRPFRYKNTCDLCDKILRIDNKGILMVKKCFILHEEVIYVFHEKLHSHNRKTVISS